MNTWNIKPSPGAKVQDPETMQYLTDGVDGKGETKPRSTYWIRRQLEGTIVVVINPAASVASVDKKGGK